MSLIDDSGEPIKGLGSGGGPGGILPGPGGPGAGAGGGYGGFFGAGATISPTVAAAARRRLLGGPTSLMDAMTLSGSGSSLPANTATPSLRTAAPMSASPTGPLGGATPVGTVDASGSSAPTGGIYNHPADPWMDPGFAAAFGHLRNTAFGSGRPLAQLYDQYLHSAGGQAAWANGTGTATGGFDTSDPWGVFSGDQRGDFNGLINRLIGAGGSAGNFDPMGNPAIPAAARSQIMGDLGARQAAARTSAALSGGGDPSLGGVGELLATLGTGGDASRAASDATVSEMKSGEDYSRALLSMILGGNQNSQLQQWLHNNQPTSNGAGQIAQTGGSIIAALLGHH